jgi:transcriptional antiterminator NusG
VGFLDVIIMMNAHYYTVHVVPGRENKTRDLLLNRAITLKAWGETIIEVFIPTRKEYVTRNGKRKIVDKKIFPGYLFIKMYLDDDSEKLVKSTDGVRGFVKSNNKPTPLDVKEIASILNNEDTISDNPVSKFKENQVITIRNGPFYDFNARVESVDEIKGRIKAYVYVFGRDTLVELDIKDAEIAE